ncbi:zinc finger protein 839 isoform X2 [Phyllostomus hastatus]|uniref:zinc finger protein 839 isoform X2 n=1 Tax=Phyllostomus hastatus TaxID=9423 RepID=UPI001E685A97|nr:zinc finger protein 839 isoform X2 [Phyllostomus hastatus]
MAGAEPEAKGSGEGGGGGGRAPPSRSGSAVRVAPLGPEQLRRVLEQVTKSQPPAKPPPPPPPPFVLQDAVRRLRDAAQQAALQRGPGSEPLRPPRLLPPQLEAVCVKVTPGETEGPERPTPRLAAIQPRTARPSQLPGRHGSVLGPRVPSLQLLGARPLLSTQPQPPVRAPAQRPLPALRPVPAKRAEVPPGLNGPGATPAPQSASDPLAVTPVSPRSANLFIPSLHTKHPEKPKKTLKVKTRSGRISRPPKHKAKDYKFIKMEDLADGHPSDSDDYAELSVEEEEEGPREQPALFDLPSCSLRPKTFGCQACAKSYIGRGGLARHFRLHPGHGPPQPEASPRGKAGRSVAQGLPSARGGLQNGQSVEAEEATVSDPAGGSCSALSEAERHPGPTGGCAAAPAQPGAAALQRTSRSSTRLREFLHQCDQQDLVELALPQLAQVVTVYEFLLMKVGKDRPAKPLFPAVYKEFEELHRMVKKMCQDYLRSSGPRPQEPLEISDGEVAESLGIPEGFLRRRETRSDGGPHPCSSQGPAGADGRGPEAAVPRKRESETVEAGLASAKRTRRAALPQEPTASSADSAGAPAAGEGPAPRAHGSACRGPEDGHTPPVSDRDPGTPQAGGQLNALADCAAPSGPADPAPSHQDTQRGRPGALTPEQAVAFPTEDAQGHSSDLHAGDSLGSCGLCSSSMSEEGVASLLPGGSGRSGAGPLGQVPGSPVSGQRASPASPGEAPPLGDVLSVRVVPVPATRSTEPEPRPPLSTQGGLGSPAADADQAPHGTGTHADQRGRGSTAAAGEAAVVGIAGGCGVLPRGREQTLVQTAGGLLPPRPGSAASGEEGVATLTEAEGPVLHTCPPEGLLAQPWGQRPPGESQSEP